VVLISRDSAYSVREFVTVAPVTTRLRRLPIEVPLGPDDGLPQVSAANLDSMLTISKSSIREFIASLSDDKVRAVDAAIHFALGLET
jgi:mRNA interferase MazF